MAGAGYRLLLIVAMLVVLPPALAAAGCYLIQTPTAEFRTPRYWTEGTEVRFMTADGVMGIEHDQVRRIRRLPASEACTSAAQAPPPAPQLPVELPPPSAPEGHESEPAPVAPALERRVHALERRVAELTVATEAELTQLVTEAEALRRDLLQGAEGPVPNALLLRVTDVLDGLESRLTD